MTSNKKAMVTGGAGFIGSHLAEELLRKGYDVTVLDNLAMGRESNLRNIPKNSLFHLVKKDIRDLNAISPDFKGIDTVFHLAALADIVPSIQRPGDYFETNVLGTFNVLEASRLAGVRKFLYVASSTCYGIARKFPTPEDAPIYPEYPYALTKNMGEQTALHWGKVYGLGVNSLRFFNVYGPRARTSGSYGAMFGIFLAQKLKGKPLTVVGDGAQTRDFTYVTDAVSALIAVAESGLNGEILNVGSGATVSVNRIAELLGGERVAIPKRPGEPDCTFADISKITRLLPWRPGIPIEKGVELLLKHIDDWKDAPLWTPESIKEATKDWFRYLGEKKGSGL